MQAERPQLILGAFLAFSVRAMAEKPSASCNCLKEPGKLDRVDRNLPALLTSYVPHIELEPIVHQRFDVETLCWRDGRDVLIRQLPQYRGLASIIKTQDQDSSLDTETT